MVVARNRRGWSRALVALVAASCAGPHESAPVHAAAAPRGHVVARVGGSAITAEHIAAVAQSEGLTDRRAALERAIDEQVLADEATRRGLADDPLAVDTARRGAIQALLVDRIERVVRADNLPPDELATGMRIRGFELSHDALRATLNAVVLADADAGDSGRSRARALAEVLHQRALALPAPRTADAFTRLANDVLGAAPHRVEPLPAIDAGGRYARGDIVPAYARAAFALANVGDVSPVVETSFGAHVILYTGDEPAVVLPDAEVRARVADELLWRLRRRDFERYVASLRARYGATVSERALAEVTRARLDEAAP